MLCQLSCKITEPGQMLNFLLFMPFSWHGEIVLCTLDNEEGYAMLSVLTWHLCFIPFLFCYIDFNIFFFSYSLKFSSCLRLRGFIAFDWGERIKGNFKLMNEIRRCQMLSILYACKIFVNLHIGNRCSKKAFVILVRNKWQEFPCFGKGWSVSRMTVIYT